MGRLAAVESRPTESAAPPSDLTVRRRPGVPHESANKRMSHLAGFGRETTERLTTPLEWKSVRARNPPLVEGSARAHWRSVSDDRTRLRPTS